MQTYISHLRTLPLMRICMFIALIVLTTYCATEIVQAQATGPVSIAKDGLDQIAGWFGKNFGRVFAFGSVLATFASMFFATFLGNLMDSTYILDRGMGDTLHLMWAVVRNFVNISFIIVLLGVAIMVVLDVGGEKGGTGLLKKFLPTFIIALVAVNFTWFGARVVLSASDLLSTVVFAVPSSVPLVQNHDIQNLYCPGEVKDAAGAVIMPKPKDLNDCMKNVEAVLTTKGTFAGLRDAGPNTKKEWMDRIDEAMGEISRLSKQETWATNFLQEGFDKKNGVFAMLLNVLSIAKVLDVAATGSLSGEKIFIGGLFAFVVAVMMLIIIFALTMGMIVRMVVLWVTIAASPLIALLAVLKEGFGIDGASKFDPLKIFMTHAFLPALVGVPISFGFIMILSGYALDFDKPVGSDNLLSYNLEHASAFNMVLWLIASILVIWVGAFKMMEVAEYAKDAVQGIRTGAEGMFKSMAGTLKYAPIIPVMGGVSSSAILSQPRRFENYMSRKSETGAENISKALGMDTTEYTAMEKVKHFGSAKTQESYNELKRHSKSAHLVMEDAGEKGYEARKAAAEGFGISMTDEELKMPKKFQEKLKASAATKFGSGQAVVDDLLKSAQTVAGATTASATAIKEAAQSAGSKISGTTAGADIKKEDLSSKSLDAVGGVSGGNVFKFDNQYFVANSATAPKDGGSKLFTLDEFKAFVSGITPDNADAKAGDLTKIQGVLESDSVLRETLKAKVATNKDALKEKTEFKAFYNSIKGIADGDKLP